jgi:hypothetical protein
LAQADRLTAMASARTPGAILADVHTMQLGEHGKTPWLEKRKVT